MHIFLDEIDPPAVIRKRDFLRSDALLRAEGGYLEKSKSVLEKFHASRERAFDLLSTEELEVMVEAMDASDHERVRDYWECRMGKSYCEFLSRNFSNNEYTEAHKITAEYKLLLNSLAEITPNKIENLKKVFL